MKRFYTSTHLFFAVIATAIALFLSGCEKISLPLAPAPEFELRDFVVTEEKTEATEYSKAYNSFKGTGTLMAKNVSSDRNMLVLLEVRDKTIGSDAEPQVTAILFRGGIGKVELSKSKYEEISIRPDYQWSILGWQELNKANIQVVGDKPQ